MAGPVHAQRERAALQISHLFTLTQSPLLGEDCKKRLELPVKRCTGVNLQTNRVGRCIPGSRGGQQTRGLLSAPLQSPQSAAEY